MSRLSPGPRARGLVAAITASLTSIGCGPGTPLRDAVSANNWPEACRLLQSNEAIPGDMEGYEGRDAIFAKAQVRVGARAMGAPEVEKQLGLLGGTSLRLVPFDSRSFGILHGLAKMPPGDVFERDWLVVEVTANLDKGAIARVHVGPVELLHRSRAARSSSDPWASRWIDAAPWKVWEPPSKEVPREQALATAMGLWREAGTRGPSLWSMLDLSGLVLTGGLIDIGARGSDPLLISQSFPAKRPSPEEAAALAALVSLTTDLPSCDLAPGASCKQHLLLQRKDPSRANAVKIPVVYTVGECSMSDWVTLPLAPASTVKAQLHARLGEAGVPLSTLHTQEMDFERSADECPAERSPCFTPKDCTLTADCALDGKCQLQGNTCVATQASCERSPACESIGACREEAGHCAWPAGTPEGCEQACAWWGGCVKSGDRCWADTVDHCARSLGCKQWGICQLDIHTCVATSASDCAASIACKERGFCSVRERSCVAASDADCKSSEICRDFGACHAAGDVCVTAR